MKTLATATLLAALALTGFARAEEPTRQTDPTPVKPVVKKVTFDELAAVLEKMGYTPQPQKDKDGKLTGYLIEVTRGSTTIPVTLAPSPSQTRVWMQVGVGVFDEKFPATQALLLEFLGKQDDLWPAYLMYYPGTKFMVLSMSMGVENFGPAALRPNLDSMFDKAMIVVEVIKKVRLAEQKAKEEVGQGTPNPLP